METDSKHAIWFSLSNELTGCGDTICGVFYIPPESSPYSVNDPYSLIKAEFDTFQTFSNALILGDFNSCTKNDIDYIELDSRIFQLINSMELIDEYNEEMGSYQNTNVRKVRQNSDKSINNLGYQLTEFLQEQNLYILNGRTKGDLSGVTTSKNVSTVDYFISSTGLFPFIINLEVLDFCPVLSDVHNPVSLCIGFNTKSSCTCNKKPIEPETKLWDRSKSNQFTGNIKSHEVHFILQGLAKFTGQNTVQQYEIDSIVDSIGKIFCNASESTFGKTRPRIPNNHCNIHTNNCKNTPKWFKSDCIKARKKFHQAKYQYKLRKTETNRSTLKESCQSYKKILSKYSNLDIQTKVGKLKKINSSDPRKFWKILNDTDSGSENRDCDLKSFSEYFKTVNSQSADLNQHNLITDDNHENINPLINSEITQDEIEKAIKKLANNKACGIDQILNEHIKTSYPLFRDVYLKLFNLILDTGIFVSLILSIKIRATSRTRPVIDRLHYLAVSENSLPVSLIPGFTNMSNLSIS